MTIKSDKWIHKQATSNDMINPFEPNLVRNVNDKKVISYGLSSYGYDIRCADEFKIFTNVNSSIVDPKNFTADNFVDFKGDVCIIPPNSFVLARTVEYIKMPRDILAICLGKSTYARCFSGDTMVKLVSGESVSFIDMIERSNRGERFYGYGVNSDGEYIVQELKSPRFIENSKLVRVYLDNDSFIDCTPDHKFLLRNGEYVQAEKLENGTSLMPLYIYEQNGYNTLYNPKTRKFKSVSHMAYEYGESAYGFPKREKYEHIHHIDENGLNNNPYNLEKLTNSEHTTRHMLSGKAKIMAESFWGNISEEEKELQLAKTIMNPEVKKRANENKVKYYRSDEGRAKVSERSLKSWEKASEERREAQREICRNINTRKDITKEKVELALLSSNSIREAARKLNCDRSVFRRFKNVMLRYKTGELSNNHKVVRVEKLKGEYRTYCLTAPLTGNFALDTGVIVKNCGVVANITPIEPEWEGHITLEFSNTTPLPAKIYANEGVAQLLFFQSNEICGVSYADRAGKYQGQRGITLPRS